MTTDFDDLSDDLQKTIDKLKDDVAQLKFAHKMNVFAAVVVGGLLVERFWKSFF